MDVECHDFDALGSKPLRDKPSKTASGSSDDCDLFGPVIPVLFRFPSEVVLCQFREETVQHGDQAESEEPFEGYDSAFKHQV